MFKLQTIFEICLNFKINESAMYTQFLTSRFEYHCPVIPRFRIPLIIVLCLLIDIAPFQFSKIARFGRI